MIDHNKSLKNKAISLPEQRKLAQDFIYASWLKTALRKNRKKIPLRERSKKIFKSMKNALVFYKKKDIRNINLDIRQRRLQFVKRAIINTQLFKDAEESKKKNLPILEKRNWLIQKINKRVAKRKKKGWSAYSRRQFIKRRSYKNKKKLFFKKRYYSKKSQISLIKNTDIFGSHLNLIVKPNNIFCNFANFKNKKTTNACSSGKYNIKVTKKTLRYTYDWVLARFFKQIKPKMYFKKKVLNTRPANLKYQKKNQSNSKKKKLKKWKYVLVPRKSSGIFITLISNNRVRKRIIRSLKFNFKGLPLIIKVHQKKVFNGCRAPKKVRKKRRKMRIFK